MKIIAFCGDIEEVIFTVELEQDVFVDVKCIGDLYYVMQCEDGREAFDSKGNTFDYDYDEQAVIKFVKGGE